MTNAALLAIANAIKNVYAIAKERGVVGISETKLGFVELWYSDGYYKLTGNGRVYLHTTNPNRMALYLSEIYIVEG